MYSKRYKSYSIGFFGFANNDLSKYPDTAYPVCSSNGTPCKYVYQGIDVSNSVEQAMGGIHKLTYGANSPLGRWIYQFSIISVTKDADWHHQHIASKLNANLITKLKGKVGAKATTTISTDGITDEKIKIEMSIPCSKEISDDAPWKALVGDGPFDERLLGTRRYPLVHIVYVITDEIGDIDSFDVTIMTDPSMPKWVADNMCLVVVPLGHGNIKLIPKGFARVDIMHTNANHRANISSLEIETESKLGFGEHLCIKGGSPSATDSIEQYFTLGTMMDKISKITFSGSPSQITLPFKALSQEAKKSEFVFDCPVGVIKEQDANIDIDTDTLMSGEIKITTTDRFSFDTYVPHVSYRGHDTDSTHAKTNHYQVNGLDGWEELREMAVGKMSVEIYHQSMGSTIDRVGIPMVSSNFPLKSLVVNTMTPKITFGINTAMGRIPLPELLASMDVTKVDTDLIPIKGEYIDTAEGKHLIVNTNADNKNLAFDTHTPEFCLRFVTEIMNGVGVAFVKGLYIDCISAKDIISECGDRSPMEIYSMYRNIEVLCGIKELTPMTSSNLGLKKELPINKRSLDTYDVMTKEYEEQFAHLGMKGFNEQGAVKFPNMGGNTNTTGKQ